MNYRDVVLVSLEAGRGHAQAGHRPAIIVQDRESTEGMRTVVVVPVTSNLSALSRFPYTIPITPDGTNSLSRQSVILAFQITTVDRRYLGRRLGALSDDALQELQESLRALLRLPESKGP